MTLTSKTSVIATDIKTLLDVNKDDLGLADVWYGDQDRIPNVPAACVEPSTRSRSLVGAPFYTRVDIRVDIIVYGWTINDESAARLELDVVCEDIEALLHQHTRLNEHVIQSFITEVIPGYKVKSGSLMIASRLVWEGLVKEMLPMAAA